MQCPFFAFEAVARARHSLSGMGSCLSIVYWRDLLKETPGFRHLTSFLRIKGFKIQSHIVQELIYILKIRNSLKAKIWRGARAFTKAIPLFEES